MLSLLSEREARKRLQRIPYSPHFVTCMRVSIDWEIMERLVSESAKRGKSERAYIVLKERMMVHGIMAAAR